MIELGIVTEVIADKAKIRVRFPRLDDTVSPEMQVIQQATAENKFFSLPKVDEQVACIKHADGVGWVCLGAIYSDRNPTDGDLNSEGLTGVKFSDGSTVIFDESTGHLQVEAMGEITAKVGDCEVHIGSKVSIKNAAGNLFTILDNLGAALQVETHQTPLGTTSVPLNVASYVDFRTQLGLILE